jgi:calcineurin-like phosphoesterase family protein
MRYFIADCHFGHTNLVMNFPRYRPGTKELFASVEEHDEYLIRAINLRVQPHDELHILGDFSLNKPGKYRVRIKCKHVYLTRGNHDKIAVSRRVFGEVPYVRLTDLRSDPGHSLTKRLRTVLCHTPMAFWEGSHKGWANLYGHCHGQREDTLDSWMSVERRSMEVSVDSIYKLTGGFSPLDETELWYRLAFRKGHDDPEFYLNNRGKITPGGQA